VLLTNTTVGGSPALPLRRDLRNLAVIGALAADSDAVLGAWHGAVPIGSFRNFLRPNRLGLF
jgi:hypothetical protein